MSHSGKINFIDIFGQTNYNKNKVEHSKQFTSTEINAWNAENIFTLPDTNISHLTNYNNTKCSIKQLDNYLGETRQLNTPTKNGSSNWSTFFIENRIQFQVELAKKNGFTNSAFLSLIDNFVYKIQDILAGTEEDPSLLHGDLWSGNYLIDVSGKPWLIDPAVYFGHREADLAMTSLFGGFNNIFYSAYNSEFPLIPEYSERESIYQLYHLLNHLNLFGSSYYGQINSILKRYL